jgi:hypothetical protein|tara:strand:- start:175 stop:291 length:117 start_codon:yes stop_codon:yes gene_type:complete
MKVKDLKDFVKALDDEDMLEIVVDDKPRYIIRKVEEEE